MKFAVASARAVSSASEVAQPSSSTKSGLMLPAAVAPMARRNSSSDSIGLSPREAVGSLASCEVW